MNKVSLKLQNCFGIESLNFEFDFSDDKNVYSIYARNGLMKTSLAKTFEKIQRKKANEIGDVIFGEVGRAEIKIDGNDIGDTDVFVIKSLDTSYESDISPLLINTDVKNRLNDVLKARNVFLKAIEKASGIKIKRTSGGKITYDLEDTLVRDFDYSEASILVNVEYLAAEEAEIYLPDIQYASIFDGSVLKKIKSAAFQNSIQRFIEETDRVYESFDFLEKGNLTLPKLKDIKKALLKDSFFIKENGLLLTGTENVTTEKSLTDRINAIEQAIKGLPELKTIEDMLTDAKGMVLKDVIETNPELVPYLMTDKLDDLRKILWVSYIKNNSGVFEDMLNKYKVFSSAIDEIPVEDTQWKQALDIFNKRFSVPFAMNISNLKGAIIGECIPQIEFSFKKGNKTVQINRGKLEELDTLSQGEKRALYLLNIIFDLEKIKNSGREILLIIDDIADSFDYKNKYAIIEYLLELSERNNIKILLLSHNYDFYRTVSSRLSVPRNHRLFAEMDTTRIVLVQEKYQKQPFSYWKSHPHKIFVLALIPFVRNIVEYGKDRNISRRGNDFDFLTALLHEKTDTDNITFADLKPLFQEYLGITAFEPDIIETDTILDSVYQECDNTNSSNATLEYKIILAIGIRHLAEKYMIRQLSNYSGTLTWNKGRESGNSVDFFKYIETKENQTRELMNGFFKIGDAEAKIILSEVNIMTPENIHFNSFMYEQILDMDVVELLNLYQSVKCL